MAGDWRQRSVSRMREPVHTITKLTLFEATRAGSLPYASATLRCMM